MEVDRDLLLVCKSAGIGEGEPDLGEKLSKGFLGILLEKGRLPAKMIFMNSGIFLTTEGSPVLEILREFERGGSEILSCGTCLEYFDRKEKLRIGKPTNMRDTVTALLEFGKVLQM